MDSSMVGLCRGCGAIRAATCRDDKEHQAKLAAEWVRDGLRLDEMSNEDIRKDSWKCTCKQSQPEVSNG